MQSEDDKRQYPRIKRTLTTKYYLKDMPSKKYDGSQIIDIGRGGLKFFSYDLFDVGAKLIFEIYFPFLYPKSTQIETVVVGVKEVMSGKTSHIHVQFVNLTPELIAILDRFEKINKT